MNERRYKYHSSYTYNFMCTNRIASMFGKALLGATLVLNSFQAEAQTETLNNKSITDLVKAGLDKSIILTTINNTNAKFDVSATSLVALKNAKVDDDIIAAMVAKANGDSIVASATTGNIVSGNHSLLNNPYYQGKPLDKVQGSTTNKTRMLGYGGANVQVEVSGEHAAIRIPSGSAISFVINTGGSAPELALYKAESKKGKRTALFAKARVFSGMKEGESTLPLNIASRGNGLYEITPNATLETGEYLFIFRNITGGNIDTYGFGIDQ